MVLEAVEEDEGWATNRVTPGKVILGNLDGIEAGVRQMLRNAPLEVSTITVPSGGEVTVPTIEETLRIKAFPAVRRNQTSDYLDLAALSEQMGVEKAAEALAGIDDFYADQHDGGRGVAAQLVRQLSKPAPADRSVIEQLSSYIARRPGLGLAARGRANRIGARRPLPLATTRRCHPIPALGQGGPRCRRGADLQAAPTASPRPWNGQSHAPGPRRRRPSERPSQAKSTNSSATRASPAQSSPPESAPRHRGCPRTRRAR